VLAALWNERRVQPLVERGTDWLAGYLSNHEDIILEKVQAGSWRWLPKWVDRAVARKITDGLIDLLTEVRDPCHPWRAQLASAVETLIVQLAEDPDFRHRGEVFKKRFLDDPQLTEHMRKLWANMPPQVEDDWVSRAGILEARVEQLLVDLGRWLQADPAIQRTLNTGARSLVRSVLAPRRQEIGRFVAQVVAGWNTGNVVNRLELQVGADLQYIRISGTVVGGLVGLTLFALSRAIGSA
jgi:uncharacterized membrane-anchored protein YjiN (DUF445 family)